jgi:hypothetical protein
MDSIVESIPLERETDVIFAMVRGSVCHWRRRSPGFAVLYIPRSGFLPPVVDQSVSLVVRADRFRVVLNTPEWFSIVLGGHEDRAIIRVTEIPSKRLQVRTSGSWFPKLGSGKSKIAIKTQFHMKRVILSGLNISSVGIHVIATMRDRSHKSMAWLCEPVNTSAES